ncbi:MAG: tetratricopeptide repeat protein, partial [Anaerolineales bacterium]
MSNLRPDDVTRKNQALHRNPSTMETQPVRAAKPRAGHSTRFWLVILILLIATVFGIAISTGYARGLRLRELNQADTVAEVIQQQFTQGLDEFVAGNYELARQRFEYVLSLDPEFPDANEFLGQALSALNQPTPTASPIASQTPTETPDFSSFEGMFSSAQSAVGRGDWTTAIDLLLQLRAEDPAFRNVEANQLMASSLRNRGMDKLYAGKLEQGIYDLTLAERFGPLDGQAQSWRSSAAFFIFANSYFGLDWALATENFGQICQANIWGACTKYGMAAVEYAGLLAADHQPCEAALYFAEGFTYTLAGAAAPTATKVANQCATATAPTPTPTVTATLPIGSLTPTATVPAGITPSDTATNTPTSIPTLPGANTATPTHTATSTATGT